MNQKKLLRRKRKSNLFKNSGQNISLLVFASAIMGYGMIHKILPTS
jgi:hypothetical protein